MAKTESRHCQALVIGAGPGGYVAAIRLAQLGQAVTLVEAGPLGGVCLNVGCIPSKALLTAAEKYRSVADFDQFGLEIEGIHFDFSKVQAYKNQKVAQMTSGVKDLIQAHQIEFIEGRATLLGPDRVLVTSGPGEDVELTFDDLVLATGSRPRPLTEVPFGPRVLSSTEALSLKEVPERLLVVGGGVIGLELATVYASFGSQVTILEGAEQVLPTVAADLVQPVQASLEGQGVKIRTGVRVVAATESSREVSLEVEIGDEKETLTADYALVSIGRLPNTQNLGLERTAIQLDEQGLVLVDSQNRTQEAHIYAIGDITAGTQLAHKASYEAKVAAEVIAGLDSHNDYYAMPSVVFSEPEIATTGYSEAALKAAGLAFEVSQFDYQANGRAVAMGDSRGFVKLISRLEDGQILGGEIVGQNASDMINEVSLAIESALTVEDLALTIHPHPTLGEMLMEAAEIPLGRPIHSLRQSRQVKGS